MRSLLVDLAFSLALPVGAWFAGYALVRLASRRRRVDAGPPAPDLGPEPPALVNLVVNDGDLDVSAADATLVDLVVKGRLELRQPTDDPALTTVHLRDAHGDLSPYEEQVLELVTARAVDGMVPLAALAFPDRAAARDWWRELRAKIVADARERGLSRPRLSDGARAGLELWAFVAAAAVAVGFGVSLRLDSAPWLAVAIGFVVGGFLALAPTLLVTSIGLGERATEAGRVCAARWLGVREWLTAHGPFAELPPASVRMWDAYLSQGLALGAAPAADLHVELGARPRYLWSRHTGRWRRIRVRYARLRPGVGRGAFGPVAKAGASLFLAAAVYTAWAGPVAVVLCGLLALNAAYHLGGCLVDRVAAKSVTGRVLHTALWRAEMRENRRWRPDTFQRAQHHLVIDDGVGWSTTAWVVPEPMTDAFDVGDTVTIRVGRYSRVVTSLTVPVVDGG